MYTNTTYGLYQTNFQFRVQRVIPQDVDYFSSQHRINVSYIKQRLYCENYMETDLPCQRGTDL